MNRHQRRAEAWAERFGPVTCADADFVWLPRAGGEIPAVVSPAGGIADVGSLSAADRRLVWVAVLPMVVAGADDVTLLRVLVDVAAALARRGRAFAYLIALRAAAFLTLRPGPIARPRSAAARLRARELYAAAGVGPCWPDLRAGTGSVAMPP